MTVSVTLPWPPAKSSPNTSHQGDWRGKAEAGKAYKNQCLLACIEQRLRRSEDDRATAEITFHPPKSGAFDLDNALAKIKRGLDAVSEKVGIDDAQWDRVTLIRGEKVKGGCVEVRLHTYSVPTRAKGAA